MKKYIILFLGIILGLMTATGCSNTNNSGQLEELNVKLGAAQEKVKELEEKLSKLQDSGPLNEAGDSTSVLTLSVEIMDLISQGDMLSLAQYVHPSKGLRFSPYFHVDLQTDQVFTAQETGTLMNNTQVYTWGAYDGSGEPISIDFSSYYSEFVYDKNFLEAEIIGNNYPIGKGNIIDNILDAYQDGYFVEYHFPSFDPQYEGMDWESLRLVFEEEAGYFYLTGIIHGQWTI